MNFSTNAHNDWDNSALAAENQTVFDQNGAAQEVEEKRFFHRYETRDQERVNYAPFYTLSVKGLNPVAGKRLNQSTTAPKRAKRAPKPKATSPWIWISPGK